MSLLLETLFTLVRVLAMGGWILIGTPAFLIFMLANVVVGVRILSGWETPGRLMKAMAISLFFQLRAAQNQLLALVDVHFVDQEIRGKHA